MELARQIGSISHLVLPALVFGRTVASGAANWPDPRFPGERSRPLLFRISIRRRWKGQAPRQDRPDNIVGLAGADSLAGPE